MDREPVVVGPDDSDEGVAWQMARHRQSNLAVIDADGMFVGLVPAHRLIGRLLAQHES